MKKMFLFALFCLTVHWASAQDDKAAVERACLNYLEGFYEGDTTKLIESLKPSLYKFGVWKDKASGQYAPDGQMTYAQAIKFAKNVLEKKHFAKAGSPKKVEVLDVLNAIAAAKVTAWWGVDYVLLSKLNGRWMIEQVLWEGPLQSSQSK